MSCGRFVLFSCVVLLMGNILLNATFSILIVVVVRLISTGHHLSNIL